jgi:hypothetical protein
MTQDTVAKRRERAGLKAIERPASAAAEAVANLFGQGDNNLTTLRNGTVLRLKAVPPHILREVTSRVPETPVPTFFNKDRDREEPNPNDPDYIEAEQTRAINVVLEMQNAMLIMGVEVVSVGDCPSIESEEWIDALDALHITVNTTTKFHRKLDWLRYVALETETDIAAVIRAVTMLSGITELEVFRQARNFRGDEERGANRGSATPATG